MLLTPQPAPELFDPAWAAQMLREMGVCLTDRQWRPLGPADEFFLRFALPALKRQGYAPFVTTAAAQVQTDRRRDARVGLVAFSGVVPTDAGNLPATTRALPAYGSAALERLAASLPDLLAVRGRVAVVTQELESLSQQLGDAYEELSLVYRIGGTMTINSPATAFLKSACQTTAGVMEVRSIGVLVWDRQLSPQAPLLMGSLRLEPPELQKLDRVLRSELGRAVDEECLLVNDLRQAAGLDWLADRCTQLLAVPMRRHGQTIGCLVAMDKDVAPEIFGTFNRGVFTSMDRKLLSGVAVHVALFLENRKLFQDTESLMMGLLHSMVAAVDAKDAYTCGHSVRVGLFAKRLAQEAGYDQRFVERVYLSGLLHDVGKIGIDDAVLRKPGRLTEEEFAQIQRHPEIGYRILKGIQQIQDILPGVLYHHERYDGRGYPQKLAGEAIPALGRILCIADSFDAMTSSRTYRTAMTVEEALAEIGRCRGAHFDPALAEAFCRIPTNEIRQLARTDRRLPDFGLLWRAA